LLILLSFLLHQSTFDRVKMNWLVIIGFAIAAAGVFVKWQARNPELDYDFNPVTSSRNMESSFKQHEELIGSDYPGYRNHCYRVLSYSLHILHGKVTKPEIKVIEAAIVYHDIGLWTDKTLAYLEPSSLRAAGVFMDEFTSDEMRLLHNIIYWHHKITPFEGPNADIVNAVREADWIDATQGLVHQGMPRKHIEAAYKALPVAGFYDTLANFGPKLYGKDIVRIVREMSSILKW
jgi:hypothetical protein